MLVVPVGRIKRSRFYSFYNLLAPLSEVKLEDVTPDPRPDRSKFCVCQIGSDTDR